MDCLDLVNNRETEYRIGKLEKESKELEDVVLHDEPIGETIDLENSKVIEMLTALSEKVETLQSSTVNVSNSTALIVEELHNIEEKITTLDEKIAAM